MKKLDQLVKRVEMFERLAVYGDRKTFLKALAQDMSKEPNFSAKPDPEPNASVDPNPPAPSGVMNMPADHITGYRPIDKNVQKMLNELLVPAGHALPIKEDGRLGPETSKALATFKQKYNKPASVAAITEVYNQSKKPATQVASPGAPLPPGKMNLPSGNTKATARQDAGTEAPVPGPKV